MALMIPALSCDAVANRCEFAGDNGGLVATLAMVANFECPAVNR
jgi:hypothetical protein